jgi:hypothetical protein
MSPQRRIIGLLNKARRPSPGGHLDRWPTLRSRLMEAP